MLVLFKETVDAIKNLIAYINQPHFKEKFGDDLYVILKRLNQDIVESFSSVQRQMCGGNTNMTAYTYGYNVNGMISFKCSSLVSTRKTNVEDIAQCAKELDRLAENELGKRRRNSGGVGRCKWSLRY